MDKKERIPGSKNMQVETPGSPMGKFQGHNINEYGPEGHQGRISEDKDLDQPESPNVRENTSEINDQTINTAGQIDRPTEKSAPRENGPTPAEFEEPGKIILKGAVTSPQEKEDIEQAIRSCAGVVDVENRIQIIVKKMEATS